MSLQIIYGLAGSGKTARCIDEIKRLAARNESILVITPEHISLQTERSIAAIPEIDGTSKITVTGFMRLAQDVFSRVGPVIAHFSDDCAKAMLIKRLLIKHKKDMTVLAGASETDEFAKTLLDTINSLKSSGITPDGLRKSAEKAGKMITKLKFKDIALIYEKYNEIFIDRLYDSADNLTRLCEKIRKFSLFAGYYIFIDGFNGFSPVQYEVIEALLERSRAVTVTCTASSLTPGASSVFFRGANTADRLFKLAADVGAEVLPNIYLGECIKYRGNPEMLHLEANLFRFPPQVYDKKTDNIKLYIAKDYFDEIEHTAQCIIKLCRNGMRYKDIAVVYRNKSVYMPLIKKTFADYKIPLFIGGKITALEHYLTSDILSAFLAVTEKFSAYSVRKWIKCAFLNTESEKVYQLDNYIVENGSNYAMWQTMPDEISEIASELVAPLTAFADSLRGRKTVSGISHAFEKLVSDVDLPGYVKKQYDVFSDSGDGQSAELLVSVYNAVIDTVNQMTAVFGDMPISLEKYYSVLRSGLAGNEQGQIPATADCVIANEIDMYKENRQAVFVAGLNEGVFPKGYINEGLINDSEKEAIRLAGLEPPETAEIKHRAENFLTYSVLTSPDERLFVSCSMSGFDGEPLVKSQIIGRLNRIFSNLSTDNGTYIKQSYAAEAEGVIPTFNRLINKRFAGDTAVLEEWYKKNYPQLYEIIERSKAYDNCPELLRRDIVTALYGDSPYYSVSKIEQFNRCAFAYFMNYGLKAKRRRENTVRAIDLGSFMHEIIDSFSKYAAAAGWKTLTDAECAEKSDELTELVLRQSVSKTALDTPSSAAMIGKIKRIMRGVLHNITDYYRQSDFELYGSEVSFGMEDKSFPPIEITADDGTTAKITGKIDRVEIYKTEGKSYINVVDYKSSDKSISYGQTLFGIQIQLPVYLDAVCRQLSDNGGTVAVPAAILYSKIDYSPVNGKRNMSDEVLEKKLHDSLKMNGIMLESPEVVDGIGSVYAVKSPATAKELELLCKTAHRRLSSAISKILKGDTGLNPVVYENKTACSYCDYKAVCGFDPLFKSNKFRYIGGVGREEFFDYVGKMD